MAPAFRGLVLAFVFFATSFVLHIIGGATDQGWLFALAVALIVVAATGFPVIALWIGGSMNRRARLVTLVAGAVLGVALTAGTLWAANERAWAWWHIPAAPALVLASSAAIGAVLHWFAGPSRRQTMRITR